MFHCVSESLTNIKLNLLKNGLEAVLLSVVQRPEILDSEPIRVLSTDILKPLVMAEVISKPGRPSLPWSTDLRFSPPGHLLQSPQAGQPVVGRSCHCSIYISGGQASNSGHPSQFYPSPHHLRALRAGAVRCLSLMPSPALHSKPSYSVIRILKYS